MMKQTLLFALLNTVIFHNVSSLKPNIFWKRARTMTTNFGGNVYKRTKTAITPIVAKLKNTNGGFYQGKSLYNSNSNEYVGYNYNDYLQSTRKYSNQQQMPSQQQQYVGDGLYQDYRNSLTGTQNYSPAPVYAPPSSPVYAPEPAAMHSYTPPAPAPVYSPPAPAPVYSPPTPAAMHSYTPPTPAPFYSPPQPAPAPIYSPPQPAPAPVYSPPQPAPAPVYVAPAPAPVYVAPAPATEKKEYSTDGLYEQYRKSLQKTNQVSDTMPQSPRNTATGFYGGPSKSSNVKDDTILYEPPAVVKSSPHLSGNRYTGNGFYQGR